MLWDEILHCVQNDKGGLGPITQTVICSRILMPLPHEHTCHILQRYHDLIYVLLGYEAHVADAD